MKRFVQLLWLIRAVFIVMTIGLTISPATSAFGQDRVDGPRALLFFDILDLPARIDEPKLRLVGDSYLLNCALANRSNEQLFGLRLVLIVVEPDGKLRSRVSWNEESKIEPASIKNFEFRPPISNKIHPGDKLFLVVDEVIGRETIWHVDEADKALRAFARGHDVMPKVRSAANKLDPRMPPPVIHEEKQ